MGAGEQIDYEKSRALLQNTRSLVTSRTTPANTFRLSNRFDCNRNRTESVLGTKGEWFTPARIASFPDSVNEPRFVDDSRGAERVVFGIDDQGRLTARLYKETATGSAFATWQTCRSRCWPDSPKLRS